MNQLAMSVAFWEMVPQFSDPGSRMDDSHFPLDSYEDVE